MKKSSFVKRGNYLVLPINGYYLKEVRLSSYCLPIFVFGRDQPPTAKINLDAVNVCLARDGVEHKLQWNRENPYSPEDLFPFLELLNGRVLDATAESTGPLHIEFSNGYRLTATPDVYEGWHFSCGELFLHGDDGRLI